MSSLQPYVLIVALILPVAAVVIGSRYLDECPCQPLIPIYLIVRGVLSIVLHILNVVGKFPDVSEMTSPCHDTKTKIFMVLNVVSLVWFSAGCYWVYGAYEPQFERQDGLLYCHPTVYQFTFWVVNLSFIVLFVYLALIAINLSKRAKDAKMMLCALARGGKCGSSKVAKGENGTVDEKAAMTPQFDYICVVDMKTGQKHQLKHSISAASFFK